MEEKYQELVRRLQEINDLAMTGSLLSWDQTTFMPPGGEEARGRQMATLARLAQEKQVDPAIGRLLEDLQPWADVQPVGSDEAALVRVARQDYDQAVKTPPVFLSEFTEHTARSYQAWTTARPNNDFAAVRPVLEKTLETSCRLARTLPPGSRHHAAG